MNMMVLLGPLQTQTQMPKHKVEDAEFKLLVYMQEVEEPQVLKLIMEAHGLLPHTF